jgi:hypothetical protein
MQLLVVTKPFLLEPCQRFRVFNVLSIETGTTNGLSEMSMAQGTRRFTGRARSFQGLTRRGKPLSATAPDSDTFRDRFAGRWILAEAERMQELVNDDEISNRRRGPS